MVWCGTLGVTFSFYVSLSTKVRHAFSDFLMVPSLDAACIAVPSSLTFIHVCFGVQDVDLPDAPNKTAQAAKPQAIAEGVDDFGLPAVPQRN